MSEHAKLSASGSHRWIACPGSVKAEEGLRDLSCKGREEGILAHTLAAEFFNKGLLSGGIWTKEAFIGAFPDFYNVLLRGDICIPEEAVSGFFPEDTPREMVKAIGVYYNIIFQMYEILGVLRGLGPWGPEIFCEMKVDYSHIVPEGFGTLDCAVFHGDMLHIFDFKYGKGQKIHAKDNTQLILYALGMMNYLEKRDDYKWSIREISLHIIQPRIDHHSTMIYDLPEMLEWADFLKAKALLALDPAAPRNPSLATCRYCKAKSKCGALYNLTKKIVEMKDTQNITTQEQKFILDNKSLVSAFLKSVEVDVSTLLLQGEPCEGYKLVEGGKKRRIPSTSENRLVEILGEKAYTKKLIPLGTLKNLVSAEIYNSITCFNSPKPIMVKDTDLRPSIDLSYLNYTPVDKRIT